MKKFQGHLITFGLVVLGTSAVFAFANNTKVGQKALGYSINK